jgi:hypothetical protein
MRKRVFSGVGGAIGFIGLLLAGILGTPANLNSARSQVLLASTDKAQVFVGDLLARMMAHRRWQDSALAEYQAHRRFHAESHRFNIESLLEVETKFRTPGPMQSTVVRQEGSTFIREHVFDKILSTESELSSKDQADVIPENYFFSLLGSGTCEGRHCWHLSIKPRRNDKYLLDGEVWLDAEDYAISRIHGTPSKHVSIWIPRSEIDWHFRRINGVWLTDRIESNSDVRVFGTIQMQIEADYATVGVVAAVKSGL